MQFRDLMQLPHNSANGRIELDDLKRALPETPEEILSQLHEEHGRNPEFHRQYEGLDIAALRWKLVNLRAKDICGASLNPNFARYVRMTQEKVMSLDLVTLKGLDGRPNVVGSWLTRKTWLTPPVLLRGAIAASRAAYHLVEGHTRVGVLCGFLERRAISGESMHKVWLGDVN